MRKFTYGLKATLFALAALATIGMFTACGGDDDGDDGGGSGDVSQEELHGGSSRTWLLTSVTTNDVDAGQLQACQQDDKYMFMAEGAAYEVVEGAESCDLIGGEPDSTVASGTYTFNADDNLLVIEGGLYGLSLFGIASDTLNVQELTSSRMVLSKSTTVQDVESTIEVTMEPQ